MGGEGIRCRVGDKGYDNPIETGTLQNFNKAFLFLLFGQRS